MYCFFDLWPLSQRNDFLPWPALRNTVYKETRCYLEALKLRPDLTSSAITRNNFKLLHDQTKRTDEYHMLVKVSSKTFSQ